MSNAETQVSFVAPLRLSVFYASASRAARIWRACRCIELGDHFRLSGRIPMGLTGYPGCALTPRTCPRYRTADPAFWAVVGFAAFLAVIVLFGRIISEIFGTRRRHRRRCRGGASQRGEATATLAARLHELTNHLGVITWTSGEVGGTVMAAPARKGRYLINEVDWSRARLDVLSPHKLAARPIEAASLTVPHAEVLGGRNCLVFARAWHARRARSV
jgi:hypothetical protein